ncbi:MAG: amidohydrolase family protein [Phycisphaerales bacterium]
MMTSLVRAAVVGLLAAGACAGAMAQERTTIVAGKMVMPDGTLAEKMGVVIVNGKIERVAPASELPAGGEGEYVRIDSAVLSPGLIDVGSSLGAYGNTSETLNPVDPALSVIDAIDASDRKLSHALRAGITSVMVTPADTNVVCGAAATVRTYSSDGRIDALRTDGPMVFSLGPAVWNADREPTSRPGSLSLLRMALKEGKEGKGDTRLSRVVSKKLGAVVKCAAIEDVDGAERTFGEFGVTPVIQHDGDGVEIAGDIAGEGAMAIVGPLTFTSSARTLSAAAAYSKEGVEVAFCAGTPAGEGAGLRATAALAARYGMAPEKARLGMTLTAAKVAGVADRVGSITAGKDADLVIFSGDPLRLDARVLGVFVKGTRVYSAPPSDSAKGANHVP